ncbi:MAG: HD domain-containing protein, partial [Clostridia bacterium]|nr:HD domain-containing protein [Clostridia bacterium]
MSITSTFDAWLSEKEALVKKVRAEMGEHRFTHTLAVAKEALSLANAFELSEKDAKRLFVAALLHDYTKAYHTEKQLSVAKEYGIALSEDDLASPPVLHSRTAAVVCQTIFPEDVD